MSLGDITSVASVQSAMPLPQPNALPPRPAVRGVAPAGSAGQGVSSGKARSAPATLSGSGRAEGAAESAALSESTMRAAAEESAQPSREALDSALEQIREFVEIAASDIDFSVDEESGERVVKIVDRETKEVIRQVPSQEMLELSRALESLQGLFLRNHQA